VVLRSMQRKEKEEVEGRGRGGPFVLVSGLGPLQLWRAEAQRPRPAGPSEKLTIRSMP